MTRLGAWLNRRLHPPGPAVEVLYGYDARTLRERAEAAWAKYDAEQAARRKATMRRLSRARQGVRA